MHPIIAKSTSVLIKTSLEILCCLYCAFKVTDEKYIKKNYNITYNKIFELVVNPIIIIVGPFFFILILPCCHCYYCRCCTSFLYSHYSILSSSSSLLYFFFSIALYEKNKKEKIEFVMGKNETV